jgi:hypothetical protein
VNIYEKWDSFLFESQKWTFVLILGDLRGALNTADFNNLLHRIQCIKPGWQMDGFGIRFGGAKGRAVRYSAADAYNLGAYRSAAWREGRV